MTEHDLEKSGHNPSLTQTTSTSTTNGEAGPTTNQDEETNRQSEKDANVVSWEGDDDPECPMNWSMRAKTINVVIVSAWTFLTPLASSMVAPGIGDILTDFHSRDATIGSFIVSIFILGYAVGPLCIAPLSEIYGRMPVYSGCNILFIIWTLACAFAPNIGGLLVFRFFEGVAGVCSLTIGSGTISDLIPAERRGAFMSVYSMGPLMGPVVLWILVSGYLRGIIPIPLVIYDPFGSSQVVGRIAGAFLAEKEGWRWVFRAGVMTIATFIFMRETYHPAVLRQKTKKLQKETGNNQLRSELDSGLTSAEIFKRAIVRPMNMMMSPIVFLLNLYMAVEYGYLYLLFTTITAVYELKYHWSSGVAGLSYLGIGIGMFIGLFGFGAFSDRLVVRLMAKHNSTRKPEYRLPIMMLGALFVPIGLFWYGWSAETRIHYIMPIIGTGWVGAGLILTFLPISTYLVDSFTMYAASAMAANTVMRSLVGAFLPLAGPSMYSTLGLGWGNSLLGFIALALWPVSFLFYKYGERIRTSKRFQVQS